MPTTAAILSPEPINGEDFADLQLKLRIADVCRNVSRNAHQLDDVHEFGELVAADIASGLAAAAVGIWEFDPGSSAWRLPAAAGDLERPDLRAALSAIRAATKLSSRALAEQLIDDIDHLLQTTCRQHYGAAGYLGSSAIVLESSTPAIRVLAAWSHALDDEQLCAAMESIAGDVALGFDAVRNHSERTAHARLYASIFDGVPCAIAGLDDEGRCTRWNLAAAQLFGWETADVIGKPLPIVAAENREQLRDHVAASRGGFRPHAARILARRWDGSPMILQTMFVPVPSTGAAPGEILLMLVDETSHEFLQRLTQCELEVATMLSSSPLIDHIGLPLVEAICRRLGWHAGEIWQLSADGERWNCTDVWKSPQFDAAMAPSMTPDRSLRCDVGLPGEAQRTREILFADVDEQRADIAIPLGVDSDVRRVLVFHEANVAGFESDLRKVLRSIAMQIGQALSREKISENLQQVEQQQQQTRKMEAIGMLAGGIAHDFNNLMTVILGNCEMLQSGAVDQSELPELIEEIRIVGERATTLTRKLLSFSRKRTTEPESLQPSQLLTDCAGMLERLVGGNIVLQTNAPEDIHWIRMDRIEFEQVILNLAANARDAMPEGGRLSLSLANAALELKDVMQHPDVPVGDFVALSVADSGCGMDAATQARIFEPFFTTKGLEKGTGLGLATVYGIVRRSRGFIRLKSAPGAGTEFTILLPRASQGIKPRLVTSAIADDPRGTETILVVDDEHALRRLVQRVLEVHGYTVLVAEGGGAALELLKAGQLCDLVLTDIVMPGMNGRQLAAEALKLRPLMPILFMSGYHDLSDDSDGPKREALLSKPFSSDTLARAVRGALDGGMP